MWDTAASQLELMAMACMYILSPKLHKNDQKLDSAEWFNLVKSRGKSRQSGTRRAEISVWVFISYPL